MRVAVTGVGGGVGQSIMKALTISSLDIESYPVDVQPLSAGLYRGIEGTVLPKPEHPDSLKIWAEWLVNKRVDALIPGSDYDLIPLARERDEWEARGICRVLVSDQSVVEICRDKATTCQVLSKYGIESPQSLWDADLEEALQWASEIGYPVVIKPRRGSASRGLVIARDEEELRFFFPRTKEPILQEYLSRGGEIEEFTCAVFADKKGVTQAMFMARRDLASGSTYRAEIKFFPELEDLLLRVGSVLRPRGPLNIQLRMTERGPVPFELNIRCSGTAAIRAYYGYNEPEMMLRHFVLGEELTPPKVRNGYAFRYWNEIFLPGADAAMLISDPGALSGIVKAWP